MYFPPHCPPPPPLDSPAAPPPPSPGSACLGQSPEVCLALTLSLAALALCCLGAALWAALLYRRKVARSKQMTQQGQQGVRAGDAAGSVIIVTSPLGVFASATASAASAAAATVAAAAKAVAAPRAVAAPVPLFSSVQSGAGQQRPALFTASNPLALLRAEKQTPPDALQCAEPQAASAALLAAAAWLESVGEGGHPLFRHSVSGEAWTKYTDDSDIWYVSEQTKESVWALPPP
jgi:hypothetical protein